MVENKSLVLAKNPIALPIIGEDLIITTSDFDLNAAPPAGGLVIKTNYVSYDPYQRGRMRPAAGPYITGFVLGQPIDNNAISTVLKSDNPRFKTGDVVRGAAKFSEYQVVSKERTDEEATISGQGGFSLLENTLGLDPKLFLGALGMSGLTAYSSFYEIGKPKEGEVIFISASSGAVGQIVGQIAKREGLKLLGSVGSDEKLRYIKEDLGFDAGFNYKTEEPGKALKRMLGELGVEGLSIYYDNVGGEQLDAAMGAMNTFGRIISCGSVSQYSRAASDTYGIKNMPLVTGKRLTIRGFIVFDADFGPKYEHEHQSNMQKWIKNGEIVVKTSVTEGIEKSAEGLVGMLKGENFGKAVLKIADF